MGLNPVDHPARECRANDVERAHDAHQRGGGDLGNAISISCGMRCVPIKPLAVPPQTKKLPQSNQEVGLPTTSRAVIVAFFADMPRNEAVLPDFL